MSCPLRLGSPASVSGTVKFSTVGRESWETAWWRTELVSGNHTGREGRRERESHYSYSMSKMVEIKHFLVRKMTKTIWPLFKLIGTGCACSLVNN